MTTRTAPAKSKATRAKAKAAPEPEVDEVEVDEVDEAPASSSKEVAFGVSDLVGLIDTKLKKKTTTRELRTLLRKMARDGRLNREIVPGNRARWEWSGPTDPEVKKVLQAFKAGELEADKQEKLAALKERKAQKQAEKKAAQEADAGDDEEIELEEE